MNRTFKYVSQGQDQQESVREATRMIQLVRHVFFDSNNLLTEPVGQHQDISMIQTSGKRVTPASTKTTLCNKIADLFGQILVEIGPQKQFDEFVCESIMSMITFAS